MADRPQYLHGVGTIGGQQFHWGSGSPGQYWSMPYGDYPVTPNAPTGDWAHRVGAIPIANNVIPDPQLGRNRIGIMIHSGSASSLDQLYTQGCFKVAPQEWPNVRAEILKEAQNGPLYLHVQPGGVASFTNTKTMDQTSIPTATSPAPPVSVSKQPANLLNRGTGSRAPIAAQQSGNESHEAFIRDYAQKIGINPDLAVGIANAEGLRAWSAQNPNAGSYIDRTAGVPWSFGDFQLNTRNGMGVDALKAGIDPRDPKQWQAADRFALDQMKSGGLAPWKGDPYAANWIKSGRPITGAGTAIAATEPGIGSGIPTPAQPNAAAVAAETPPQNAGDWLKKLAARPPPTKDANGNEVQGKSPLENIANSFKPAGGQQQAAAPEPAQFAPPQDPMAQLAGPSSQMFQAVSQAAARPLSWTSTPYGSMAGQQYGMPGTTLNSRGDYYGS